MTIQLTPNALDIESSLMVRIGNALLIRGDCATHAEMLSSAHGILTDPPYGIGYQVNARSNRGIGLIATKPMAQGITAPIHGDDAPFDPAPWLRFPVAAFFGAQHFSNLLPVGRWLIWDKRRESKPDSHSDGDMIWMTGNSREALRIHRQKWRGVVREGEENCSRSKKLHPNQKPVALLTIILERLGLVSGQTVADPYMGSGSTAVAALRLGLHFIGCEIDPIHFETAKARLITEFGSTGSANG